MSRAKAAAMARAINGTEDENDDDEGMTYGAVWYAGNGMLCFGMARYGMIWCGMVLCDMILHSKVWFGVVWYGVVDTV